MSLAFSLQMLANLCVVWYTQAKQNKPIKAASYFKAIKPI